MLAQEAECRLQGASTTETLSHQGFYEMQDVLSLTIPQYFEGEVACLSAVVINWIYPSIDRAGYRP